MTTELDPAERIAAAICWLDRQTGLPDIDALRIAVVDRHEDGCGWCDYPLPELLRMSNLDGARGVGAFARMPQHQQRHAVRVAQGIDSRTGPDIIASNEQLPASPKAEPWNEEQG